MERTDAFGETSLYAEARGALPGDRRALLIGATHIKISASGEFVADLPITGEIQAFRLSAVDIRGNIQKGTLVIEVPHFAQIKDRLLAKNRPRSFAVGLSYSSLAYQESGISQVSQPSLTLKLGYHGAFGPTTVLSHLTYSLSGYMTVTKLSSNTPDATMQFLGLNARLGYPIPHLFGPDSTWSANIGFGYYFTTMFVTVPDPTELFGFQNLMGLQLFPTLQKTINANNSVMAYFKFAPISSGIGFSNLGSNREFATGLLYTHRLSNYFDLLSSLDWANLQYQLEGSQIESKSLSFGLGLGF